MQNLAQANLALPMLLIGADVVQVRNFCQQLLATDPRTQELFAAGVHPDFLELTPDIEAVRDLGDFVHSRPQFAHRKVVLIVNAEKLNTYAANALLKNLEEPQTDTLFILLAPHANLLLPTIVSRCQVLQMQQAIPVMQDKVGQILVDLDELWRGKTMTLLQIVDKWQSQFAGEVLYWLELAVSSLIKQSYLEQQQPAVPMSKLWAMLEQIKAANAWRAQNMQPNAQLLLEAILLA